MKKEKVSRYGKLSDTFTNIENIDKYFEIYKLKDTSVTDEVYNDLNIEDIFHYSNRCISPIGEMILYYKLRHVSTTTEAEKTEPIIEKISHSFGFREKLETILDNLSKETTHSISNLLDKTITLSKWHKYIKYIPFVYLCIIIPMFLLGQFASLIITSAIILIINVLIHYWNKLYVEMYIRPLIELLKVKTAASKICSQLDDDDTNKLKESIDAINLLEKKLVLFSLNKYIESDLALLVSSVVEFVKLIFLIEPICIYNILRNGNEYKLHSKRLIRYVGEWDVLFANASLRSWLKDNDCSYSCPVFNHKESNLFRAKGIYNPLIPNCITNDISINNSTIITGSNMSGKSTFLRTIGINIVSSYALNICYASSMELSNCNLNTVLSVSDDINSSKSYFFSEVERIKFAIDMCTKGASNANTTNIVLIDEIFKGTNTIERIAISNAVIKYFINTKNAIVIVSTHDIELAKSFTDLLDIFHFDESLCNNKMIYDYKIKFGLEYNRNAIAILKYNNYPIDIVMCAEQNALLMQK